MNNWDGRIQVENGHALLENNNVIWKWMDRMFWEALPILFAGRTISAKEQRE